MATHPRAVMMKRGSRGGFDEEFGSLSQETVLLSKRSGDHYVPKFAGRLTHTSAPIIGLMEGHGGLISHAIIAMSSYEQHEYNGNGNFSQQLHLPSLDAGTSKGSVGKPAFTTAYHVITDTCANKRMKNRTSTRKASILNLREGVLLGHSSMYAS